VQSRDYHLTVEVTGREPLILSRLGRRTDELAGLLTDRLRGARGRTAAFLGSLLPRLDPMALRGAAGLLRDGVAVPASTLNAIHSELAGTLVQIAALPDRQDAVAELGRRTDLAVGFKQLVSAFRPGMTGMMAAGVMDGFGGLGRYDGLTKDLSALVTSGENPTVLALVLGRRGDRVVYEVLNRPEPPTFVYRAAGADGMTAINRGSTTPDSGRPPR